MTNKVWVAELDIKFPGFTGSWLDVHETPDGALASIAERAHVYGVEDIHARALETAMATRSDVAYSSFIEDGERSITWVINRHTVQS